MLGGEPFEVSIFDIWRSATLDFQDSYVVNGYNAVYAGTNSRHWKIASWSAAFAGMALRDDDVYGTRVLRSLQVNWQHSLWLSSFFVVFFILHSSLIWQIRLRSLSWVTAVIIIRQVSVSGHQLKQIELTRYIMVSGRIILLAEAFGPMCSSGNASPSMTCSPAPKPIGFWVCGFSAEPNPSKEQTIHANICAEDKDVACAGGENVIRRNCQPNATPGHSRRPASSGSILQLHSCMHWTCNHSGCCACWVP